MNEVTHQNWHSAWFRKTNATNFKNRHKMSCFIFQFVKNMTQHLCKEENMKFVIVLKPIKRKHASTTKNLYIRPQKMISETSSVFHSISGYSYNKLTSIQSGRIWYGYHARETIQHLPETNLNLFSITGLICSDQDVMHGGSVHTI